MAAESENHIERYLCDGRLSSPSDIRPSYGVSSQIVDFNICGPKSSSQLTFWKSYDLVFDLQNKTSEDIDVKPLPYHFQRISAMIGGHAVCEIGGGRALEICLLDSMREKEFKSNYVTLGYPADNFLHDEEERCTIPANSSHTFRLPVHHIFPWFRIIYHPKADSDVTLRFYVNPCNMVADVKDGSLYCDNMELSVRGYMYSPSTYGWLAEMYASDDHSYDTHYYAGRDVSIGDLKGGNDSMRAIMMQSSVCESLRVDLVERSKMTSGCYPTELWSHFRMFDRCGSSIHNGFQDIDSHLYKRAQGKRDNIFPQTTLAGYLEGKTSRVDRGPHFVFGRNGQGGYYMSGMESMTITAPKEGYEDLRVFLYYKNCATFIQHKDGTLSFEYVDLKK